MATIRRFEEIQAWQKAREMVREIYQTCADGLLARDFGLRDQIRRAAVSTMANIAEGFGRKTGREFAHFLDMARGSANEVQSLLYVALDVRYFDAHEFERLNRLAHDSASLIGGLTTYLRGREERMASRARETKFGVRSSELKAGRPDLARAIDASNAEPEIVSDIGAIDNSNSELRT